MPAYNAARTIEKTWREVIAHPEVDLVIVVDDASSDETVATAQQLEKVITHVHPVNRGYGANQKTCYQLALDHGADIVVMVHPDYQYTPKLIPAMVGLVRSGLYACVLGSRILGGGARQGGMPLWRYVPNRFLTLAGNVLLGTKVSEFHTGYRAYSRELLERLPLSANSDDFVFDNELLGQIFFKGYEIAEITCPTQYFDEASYINFKRSSIYGLGVFRVSLQYFLQKAGIAKFKLFKGIKTK